MNNQQYNEYVENRSHSSPCFLNCIKAFITGGSICCLGEILTSIFKSFDISEENSLLYSSIVIIILAGLLTGIGIFDKIAKFGGGGALVPITGFANSVAAPAIEAKSEGFITGVATKMFTICGPVIVYGTVASTIYGIIYWIIKLF